MCRQCKLIVISMEGSFGVRKGAWAAEEDNLLRRCIERHGEGRWHQVPLRAGLNRCRKSCRLRWLNYLKPNIKRGEFSVDEIDLIMRLHKLLGNRWSLIAGRIPGRTANDIKNYWNTHLRKKLCEDQTEPKLQHRNTIASKTNVVRPCPRTFSSRNCSSPLLIPTATVTTDNGVNGPKITGHYGLCGPSSGSNSTGAGVAAAPLVVHEPNNNNNNNNNNNKQKSLIDNNDDESEKATVSINVDYSFTNLWPEENLGMELGDNFVSDFSFDVDLWNLFG